MQSNLYDFICMTRVPLKPRRADGTRERVVRAGGRSATPQAATHWQRVPRPEAPEPARTGRVQSEDEAAVTHTTFAARVHAAAVKHTGSTRTRTRDEDEDEDDEAAKVFGDELIDVSWDSHAAAAQSSKESPCCGAEGNGLPKPLPLPRPLLPSFPVPARARLRRAGTLEGGF